MNFPNCIFPFGSPCFNCLLPGDAERILPPAFFFAPALYAA